MFLPLQASVHSILTSLFQFTIFKSMGPKMDPSSPKNLQYVIFFHNLRMKWMKLLDTVLPTRAHNRHYKMASTLLVLNHQQPICLAQAYQCCFQQWCFSPLHPMPITQSHLHMSTSPPLQFRNLPQLRSHQLLFTSLLQ